MRLNRIGTGNSSSFGGQHFIGGRVDFSDFFAWVEGLLFLDSLRFEFFMELLAVFFLPTAQRSCLPGVGLHSQAVGAWKNYE
jgi:hypothetical protein